MWVFCKGDNVSIFCQNWSRKNFLAVYFVNTSSPEKKLSKLPDESLNNFETSNIDLYIEKPSATSCNGKYRIFVTQF